MTCWPRPSHRASRALPFRLFGAHLAKGASFRISESDNLFQLITSWLSFIQQDATSTVHPGGVPSPYQSHAAVVAQSQSRSADPGETLARPPSRPEAPQSCANGIPEILFCPCDATQLPGWARSPGSHSEFWGHSVPFCASFIFRFRGRGKRPSGPFENQPIVVTLHANARLKSSQLFDARLLFGKAGRRTRATSLFLVLCAVCLRVWAWVWVSGVDSRSHAARKRDSAIEWQSVPLCAGVPSEVAILGCQARSGGKAQPEWMG